MTKQNTDKELEENYFKIGNTTFYEKDIEMLERALISLKEGRDKRRNKNENTNKKQIH